MTSQKWYQRIGNQRDWVWRGWQIRYTYMRAKQPLNKIETHPLIFLHGFGASIKHWRNNIPVISEKHTVYALDLLGFGASKKVYTNYQIDLWSEQIYEFWQNFIGQPVILVGNSLGSLVCVATAANYPSMVKGMILINLPDVSLRNEVIPPWLNPILNVIEEIGTSPLLLKPLFKFIRQKKILRLWANIAYVDKKAVDDELVEILATPPTESGASNAFCALAKAPNRPGFSPQLKLVLPSLNIPILLLWGKNDRMIPPTLAPILAKLNPRIELVELDNAGHCLHDEYPDWFNYLVLDWISNHFHPKL